MFGGGGSVCKSVSCSLLYSLSDNSSFSGFFLVFFCLFFLFSYVFWTSVSHKKYVYVVISVGLLCGLAMKLVMHDKTQMPTFFDTLKVRCRN